MENLPQSYNQNKEIGFSRNTGGAVGTNVGAVAIEQERAIAEAQGQLIMAKRFPRDLNKAHAALMISCKSPAFANVAFYSVPNRGTGPSIRFAEEVARVFQNFEFGHRELSRTEGKSEIEVYAWDKEDNNRSIRQITVMHVTDTRNGPKKLTDQADVDNKIANVASKQVRGRILALMPKWLVEDAIQECKKTITGTNDEPISVRVRKMTQAFAKFGVTTDHLERYLGNKLDDVMIDQLVDMTGVYNALREGAKPSDYFEPAKGAESTTPNPVVDTLNKQFSDGVANDNNPAATQAVDGDAESKPAAATPRARSRRAAAAPKETPADEQAPEVKPEPEPSTTNDNAAVNPTPQQSNSDTEPPVDLF